MTRRDAVENRERVLDAAIAVFGEHGVAASTEAIAERAGVGAGTVFRHFPTKQALMEAVLEHMLAQLAEHARSKATERDAGTAFFDALEHAIASSTTKKLVAESLLAAGVDLRKRISGGGFREAIAALLVRAQAAGAVRKDVGVGEVMGVLVAISRATELVEPSVRERTMAVLLDGLRPPARTRRKR